MIYVRKNKAIIILAIVLLISVIVSLKLVINSNAYGLTTDILTPEQYTNSDYLINSDGTENKNKNIVKFSDEVKAAEVGTSFPELANVIPRHYLESTETNAVFAYNGHEYGFYVAKTGNRFDVLLIDFVFEFDDKDHTEVEQKIKIKPILQQSFYRRNVAAGGYKWEKYSEEGYTYYVANPRFATAIYNENALNYGDDGYSKYNDEGVILSQFRVNYGKICYATEEDLSNILDEFKANKIFDCTCSLLDSLTGGIGGTVLSTVKDIVDLQQDIYEAGKEVTVLADNEANINTYKSKSEQRNDTKLSGYTRVAAFESKDEIVLSDDSDSYAELIAVFNETNYKCRMIRLCDFDIVRRDFEFKSMEKVASADEDRTFSFSRENTLFDKQPQAVIDSDRFDGAVVPVYLLPRGDQTVTFTPKYSGEYSFDQPKYTSLSFDGYTGGNCYLQAGQTYTFKLSNLVNAKIMGGFMCSIERYSENNVYSVPANENRLLCFMPDENQYKQVSASNSNIKLSLLDENLNVIADGNSWYHNFLIGRKYYFLLTNSSDKPIQAGLIFNDLRDMTVGVTYEQLYTTQVMRFTNKYSAAVNYKLTITNSNDARLTISNRFGSTLSAPYEPIVNGKTYTFSLSANETYYIRFDGDLSSAAAALTVSPTQCKWKVGSSASIESSTKLKPNASYSIEMDMYVNNIKIDTFKSFICYAEGLDCTHSDGLLKIGNVANKERIILIPREAPDFGLTVIVDNMIRSVTLKHCDGTDNYDRVNVELGTRISGVDSPYRKGYTFLGYYTKENGKGKQYLNGNMQSVEWDIDADNSTLYAHWKVNTYTISLCLSNDHSLYDQIQVNYNDFITYTKTREHFYLIGIFSGPYQQGIRYVHSELQDSVINYQHNVMGKKYVNVSDRVRWDNPYNGTLYIEWANYTANYTVQTAATNENGEAVAAPAAFKTWLASGYPNTLQAPVYDGYTFDYWVINDRMFYGETVEYTFTLKPFTSATPEIYNPNAVYDYKPGSIVAHYKQDNCVASGTLITLADGRQVPVESLTGEETLLVWNLMTGQFDSASILFIDKDPARIYRVINLGFSDGTAVKVISEHAFWDCELNKYVYLREDADKYIGHWFKTETGKVQLTDVEVREEYTTAYSPVTYGHLCYYVNGMLSMPGGIQGLFNIFEVDPNSMKINIQAMEQDIEKYGTYTYEELAEIVPVSKEVYEAINGQYLKVAVGKGLVTVEQLRYLAQRYSVFFE